MSCNKSSTTIIRRKSTTDNLIPIIPRQQQQRQNQSQQISSPITIEERQNITRSKSTTMYRTVDDYLEQAAAAASSSSNQIGVSSNNENEIQHSTSQNQQSTTIDNWWKTIQKQWKYYLLFISLGIANSSDAAEILCVSYILSDTTFQQQILLSGSYENTTTESINNSFRGGIIASIVFFGMLLGGLIVSIYSDWFGRRLVLQYGLLCGTISGLVSCLSTTITMFCICRFFAGIGIGTTIPPLFALCTELSIPSCRGYYISIVASFWMIGSIYVAIFGWILLDNTTNSSSSSSNSTSTTDFNSIEYFFDNNGNDTTSASTNSDRIAIWRIFIAICTIPSFIGFLLIYYIVPESPRFLLLQNRHDEALIVINYITTQCLQYNNNDTNSTSNNSITNDDTLSSPLPQSSNDNEICINSSPLTIEELYYYYPPNNRDYYSRMARIAATTPTTIVLRNDNFVVDGRSSGTSSSRYRGTVGLSNNRLVDENDDFPNVDLNNDDNVDNNVNNNRNTFMIENDIATDIEPELFSYDNISSGSYSSDNDSSSAIQNNEDDGVQRQQHRRHRHRRRQRRQLSVVNELCILYTEFTVSILQLYTNELCYTTTIPLQLVWFTLSYSSYGLLTWINTLFIKVQLQNVYSNSLLFSISNLPGNILSGYCLDKFGNRAYFLSLCIGIASLSLLSFAYEASLLSSKSNLNEVDIDESTDNNNNHHKVVIVVSACIFQCFTIAAWNTIDVLTSELFPTSIRATGMGICTATGRVGAMIAQFINSYLLIIQQPSILLIVSSITLLFGAIVPLVSFPPDVTGQPIHDFIVNPSPNQQLLQQQQQDNDDDDDEQQLQPTIKIESTNTSSTDHETKSILQQQQQQQERNNLCTKDNCNLYQHSHVTC